jgi:nucleoid-associated protein YgaU
MIDPRSRYAAIGTGTLTVLGSDGTAREVRYLLRRFIPPGDAQPTVLEHAVEQGDRLDNIAARTLGDATDFWRICDANHALDPDELTDEIGRRVKIALPVL